MSMTVTRANPAFLELINSEHIHGPSDVTDHLDDTYWVAALVERWGLPGSGTPDAVADLRELRMTLRAAVEQLMENARLSPGVLARLNARLRREEISLQLRVLDEGKYELVQVAGRTAPDVHAARSFATYMATADVRRLKLCANSSCRWAFQDGSRNRSKLWCSSQTCGNLTKVRAFRSRAKVVAVQQ